MIRMPGADGALELFPVGPNDVFHAECEILPGPSLFLFARARVRVDDGGRPIDVFVKPDELPERNGRKYVQFYVDALNKPDDPGAVILGALWSAVDRRVRDTVPKAWVVRQKLHDPFPPKRRCNSSDCEACSAGEMHAVF